MSNNNSIESKLSQFARKYYTNELIKGLLLFTAFGFLYFFLTILIEHLLWLKPIYRTFLFWIFIIVELFLVIRFIGFPIFKLIGLKKGISQQESSKIIGDHFPEVKDKLTNILQLKNSEIQSELLSASIEQKSKLLSPISFTKAISFNTNIKYLKYALIPLVIWMFIYFTGKTNSLNNSFDRIVNHQTAYLPPAPFSFHLTQDNLNVVQGESLTIYVETKGEVIPQEAKIVFDNEQYFLENQGNGLFTYTFSEITKPTTFNLTANDVDSYQYQINIIETPTIQGISMQLFYPAHLKKASKTINNTGNITIPEGTMVQWKISAKKTDSVAFINNYKKIYFNKKSTDNFSFSKQVKNPINYQISTSNKNISDYEKLQFSIDVIKDEMPEISVLTNIDSITRGTALFTGQISDDNGIRSLSVVYYDIENQQNILRKNLKISSENVQSFFFEFPNNDLKLVKGINYEMYFELSDNDIVNGFKKATSKRFSYRQKTDNEEKEQILEEQKDYIDQLSNSLENQEKSKKELEKFQFDLQNKKSMNWNDKKKIKNLVKRQQQYKKMMQRNTKKLQENFSEKKEATKSLQEKKEALQERIEELKKLKKQEKILDELQKLADKLNKEDLVKKAKELAAQNKQQERSLERVLEMTKQFYVEQKMSQLSEKLNELAKKQEELAKKENATKEEQEALNKEFEELKKQLKDLKKENSKLKNPTEIPSVEELKRDTDKKQKQAKKSLEKGDKKGAQKKQKEASENMKKMSKKLQESMAGMSMEMEKENMEDLRYLTENLITYSFDQEELMNVFAKTNTSDPNFGKNLRKQHQLKNYFEHIDDSLFALSLRLPKLSTKIDEKIANAHHNINQSLENFADGQFHNGVKNQRYVMTAVNELADMLSSTLDAMKNPKKGKGTGKGKGESFSLPDIIQKQGDLLKKMQEGIKKKGKQGPKGKKGNKGKKGEKNGPKKGEKPGKKGSSGSKGDPKKGKNGEPSPEGESEGMDGELYKIYQEQTRLREELEKAMKEGSVGGKNGEKQAKKTLEDMKRLENQIIERGLNRQSMNQMQRIQNQMLKLKSATLEQGEDEKRKSTTNTKTYNRNQAKALEFKKKYFNQTEILNRQALPLKDTYKKKVQEYFMKKKVVKVP